MGYSYSRTPAGVMALDCDYCGKPGGVRKRTCPYKVTSDNSRSGERYALPYCRPPAACRPCWKTNKATAHADCKDGAAQMQAQYDATQARLDAGELLAIAARCGDAPAGMVRVTFVGAGGGGRVDYLMPDEAYSGGGFLSDYRQAVPVDQAPAKAPETCDHQTGQPGCALATCWGVPCEPVLDRGRVTVSEEPLPAQPGTATVGRAFTLAVRRAIRSQDVTMPDYADSGWYERTGVRQVQAWDFRAGRCAVRVLAYESRTALMGSMPYAAVYIDGQMVVGDTPMYRATDAVAATVAHLVAPYVERAAAADVPAVVVGSTMSREKAGCPVCGDTVRRAAYAGHARKHVQAGETPPAGVPAMVDTPAELAAVVARLRAPVEPVAEVSEEARAFAGSVDRTSGELDAAILANRENPTPESHERVMAAMRVHKESFFAEERGELMAKQYGERPAPSAPVAAPATAEPADPWAELLSSLAWRAGAPHHEPTH